MAFVISHDVTWNFGVGIEVESELDPAQWWSFRSPLATFR
jgi:hypothetical protein